MALIRLSAYERKKLSIFFTCILLAFSVWMFYSLSQKYDYKITTIVSFKNLPQHKAFYPLQSDTVVLTVRGTGFQILFNRLSKSLTDIKVDLTPLERRHFVTFNEQIYDINNQFFSNQKVIAVYPDTLFFDFTTRKVKRVPVKLNSELNFKNQFSQSGKTVIKPAFVTITGPEEILRTIEFWQTDTFKTKNLEKSLNKKLYLKASKEANISIFPNIVDVSVPIEEFTEKELDIPIRVINNPNYYHVKLIPSTIKVVVFTSLSDYAKVSPENITATVDLALWKELGAGKLPVVIKNENDFVKVQTVSPQQVDFFIDK